MQMIGTFIKVDVLTYGNHDKQKPLVWLQHLDQQDAGIMFLIEFSIVEL